MSHSTPQPSALKVCSKCGESKPLTEFHKDKRHSDGRESRCAVCKNLSTRVHYYSNLDEQRESARERQRAFTARNRELVAERRRERYAATERKVELEKERSERARNPLRTRAKNAVRTAVINGTLPLVKSLVCSVCQEAQARQYHHHKGYEPEFWLDVVALCTECHGKEHWVDQ